MARPVSDLPAPLVRAAGRFAAWRRRRASRRIPEELWGLAAGLAERYGVSRTARALRVQYNDLRKRVTAAAGSKPRGGDAGPAFVEIVAASAPSGPACVVELEVPSGARMRMEMTAAGPAELVALSRAFLEPRS